MEMYVTVIVSLVAAVSAILSPVLTTLINNRHQYKMRKLELLQEQKLRAVQQFTSSCSTHLAAYNKQSRDEYYKSYGEIFLYVNKKHWAAIEALNSDIEEEKLVEAGKKLTEISQSLSSEMKI